MSSIPVTAKAAVRARRSTLLTGTCLMAAGVAAGVVLLAPAPARATPPSTTISSATAASQTWSSGNFVVTNTGSITPPSGTALHVTNPGAGTLSNSGLIQGMLGVNATGGIGAVNNLAGGRIVGTIQGLSNGGSISAFSNAGTISGATGLGNGGTLGGTVSNTGTIQGVNKGFNNTGAIGTLNNSAFIGSSSGTTGSGLVNNFGANIAAFNNSGTVAGGTTSGVGVFDSGVFTQLNNTIGGVISGHTGISISSFGSVGTLSNAGSISSLINGGTIGTGANAAISISSTGGIGALTNSGHITGQTGIENIGTIGTLTNTGTISGRTGISNIGNIDAVNNSGLISSATHIAISNDGTIGALTNAGTITSQSEAIQNSGLITALTNTGRIVSGSTSAISNNGRIGTLTNTGTITGFVAIANGGSIGTLSNGGALLGSGAAIDNDGTISLLTMQSTGVVQGATGIYNARGATIGSLINAGRITVNGSSQIAIDNNGVINTLTNSGTISNQRSVAVIVNSGSIGTLSNSGRITSASSNVIANGGSIGLLSNTGSITGYVGNQGTISVLNNGGYLGGVNNYNNIGTIINTALVGGEISNYGTINTINNTGLINNSVYNGVTIGTLTNGGTIQGYVINSGTIGGINNSGVLASAVSNTGTIGSINNSGTMSGPSAIINGSSSRAGSSVGSLGVVTNTGMITGQITNYSSNALSITGGSSGVFGTLTGPGGAQSTITNTHSDLFFAGNLLLDDVVNVGTHNFSSSGTLQLNRTVNLTGNFIQTGGMLLLGVTSTSNYGNLTVSGTAALSNATISLKPLVTGVLAVGQTYNVVVATGALTATALTASVSGFNASVTTAVVSGKNDLVLTLNSVSVAPPVVVTTPPATTTTTTTTTTPPATTTTTTTTTPPATTTTTTPPATTTPPPATTTPPPSTTFATAGGATGSGGVGAALDQIANGTDPAGAAFRSQVIPALKALSAANLSKAIVQLSPSAMGGQFSAGASTPSSSAISQHQQGFAAAATGRQYAALDGDDYYGGPNGTGRDMWGKLVGAEAHDTAGQTTQFDASTYGLVFGADLIRSKDAMVGVAVSWLDSRVDGKGDVQGSNSHLSSYQVTAYGSMRPEGYGGHVVIDGQLAFGYNRYDQQRQIDFLGVRAHATFNGEQYLASGAIGYAFTSGAGEITPYTGLSEAHISNKGYSETGAGIADLAVRSLDTDTLIQETGVKFDGAWDTGLGHVTPTFRIGWAHQYTDGPISVGGTLAGVAFTSTSVRPNADGAAIGLGATLERSGNMKIGLEYQGDLRSNFQSHTGAVKVTFNF